MFYENVIRLLSNIYRITSAKTYREGFYGGKVYTVVSSWAFLLLPPSFLPYTLPKWQKWLV